MLVKYNVSGTKLPIPKAIPVILVSKFFENIVTQAIKTILVIYLIEHLRVSVNKSITIFHAVNAVRFLTAIVGAIISDSWCGRYYTQFYTNWLHLAGVIALFVCSVPTIPFSVVRNVSIAAFFVVAIANGVMKPCTIAIGSDQYKLPEQHDQMTRYFARFYFVVKLSGLIGTVVAPVLRTDLTMMSQDDRYMLLFGTFMGLIVISTLVFLAGSRLYVKNPPAGNRLLQIGKCTLYSLKAQCRNPSTEHFMDHWLDAAKPTYGERLVLESRIFWNVTAVLLPLPLIWALIEQVGSSWVLQATQMDGRLGASGFYTIKPDQMQMLAQLLVIVLIPVCDAVVYPLLVKIRIAQPLQKLVFAGGSAMLAYLLAGAVQVLIERRAGVEGADRVHMVWLLPQYALIALSEAIMAVTTLVLMNTESPASLKTVMQAMCLVCVAFGNLINVLILGIGFASLVHVFFMYAVLMVPNCAWLLWFERRYQRIEPAE